MTTIEITFPTDGQDGDHIEFDRSPIVVPFATTMRHDFISKPRTQPGVIQEQTPTATAGEATAIAYVTYFGLDYNQNGLFEIERTGNVVTLTIPGACEWSLADFDSSFATANITNCTPSPYQLNSATFSEVFDPADRCDEVEMTVDTSDQTGAWTLNIGNQKERFESVVGNPFNLNVPREVPWTVVFEQDVVDPEKPLTITYPEDGSLGFIPKIYQDNIIVNIVVGFGGATVTVNVFLDDSYISNPELELEYSLNGVDWQTNNVFSGQADGNYTMFVRDQFGCQKTKDYTVSGVSTRPAFIEVSRANSIGFTKREDIDDKFVLRHFENTLACEQLKGQNRLNYTDVVPVEKGDALKIQFKTNYGTPRVWLRDEDENEYEQPIFKQSSNLSRFGNYEGYTYLYQPGLTGIYFTSGNIYDQNDIAIGTHELQGNLPEYAVIGNQINISGIGDFEIKDVVFDDNISRRVIIVEHDYTEAVQIRAVKSFYDLLNYEVYHTTLQSGSWQEGIYDMYISFEDPNYDTELYQSENIWIKEGHEYCVMVDYWNENNRDIFYDYDITHRIRLPFLSVTGIILDSIDVTLGDDNATVNKSTLNRGIRLSLSEMTYNLCQKAAIAFSSQNLFVNGIGFVRQDAIEMESVEGTNLYRMSVNLIDANTKRTTQADYTRLPSDPVFDPIDIGRVLTTGTNLIRV